MVTPTENHTCIKDHLKVATKYITEVLDSQGLVVDKIWITSMKMAIKWPVPQQGIQEVAINISMYLPLRRQYFPLPSPPPSIMNMWGNQLRLISWSGVGLNTSNI